MAFKKPKTEEQLTDEFAEFEKQLDDAMGHRSDHYDEDPEPEVVDPETEGLAAGDQLDAGTVEEDSFKDEPTPDDEPAPSIEPTEDSDPGADEATPTPEDGENLFTLPDEEFYGELRGQKVTSEQLQEAGLLSKMLTRDHQVSNYQKKYEERDQQFNDLSERLAAIENPTPTEDAASAEPEMTPEELMGALENSFDPVLQQMADNGLIEPDWAAVYPKKARLDAYYVDTILRGLGAAAERLDAIENRVGEWSKTEDTQKDAQTVGGIMRDMVKDDSELYGGLSDADTQDGFFKFLGDPERNPFMFEPEEATPEKMKAAYLIYHSQGNVPTPKPAPKPPEPDGQRRMGGTGGGSGGRGDTTPGSKGDKSKFQEFEDQLEVAQAERFAE